MGVVICSGVGGEGKGHLIPELTHVCTAPQRFLMSFPFGPTLNSGGGGVAIKAEGVCLLVLPGGTYLFTFLRRESSTWLTPTAGENYFHWVRVGQLSLCSQVLLLPLGVPPTPVPAMLSTKSFIRQRNSEGAHHHHHHQCGRCDTGPEGSGSPSVTHQWCAAYSGIMPIILGVFCLCSVPVCSTKALQWGLGPELGARRGSGNCGGSASVRKGVGVASRSGTGMQQAFRNNRQGHAMPHGPLGRITGCHLSPTHPKRAVWSEEHTGHPGSGASGGTNRESSVPAMPACLPCSHRGPLHSCCCSCVFVILGTLRRAAPMCKHGDRHSTAHWGVHKWLAASPWAPVAKGVGSAKVGLVGYD